MDFRTRVVDVCLDILGRNKGEEGLEEIVEVKGKLSNNRLSRYFGRFYKGGFMVRVLVERLVL